MLEQDRGHIVNVSTTLVEHANARTPAALATLTKGGLTAVTRSLAIVRLVRPARERPLLRGDQIAAHAESSYATAGGLHPLGRTGEIQDVVSGVLYLESAPFVTGEILHIDGGQSAGH